MVTAVPATADDSAIPPPVMLSPSPAPEATASSAASTDDEATADEPDPTPSPADSREGDVLVSVSVAMAAQAAPPSTRPSVSPPRARLPLRLGHYGMKVSRLQERLSWLGYRIAASNIGRDAFGTSTREAVRRFQVKNGMAPTGRVDQRMWKALRHQAEPIGILPLRCTEVKAALCIDKTSRTLRYVVKGEVRLVTDARFGAPGMETDEGVFAVREKSFDHVSSIYRTWMPRAMFFNGDEAVHYSPDFNAVGYLHGSHGCVGIRDLDVATRLFEKVDVGTRVYVYWS